MHPKKGVPKMCEKNSLLSTGNQVVAMFECSTMLHHVHSARWKSPFLKDFDEYFFSRIGKGSHPSEVTQWSECGGRSYVVLMTNLHS